MCMKFLYKNFEIQVVSLEKLVYLKIKSRLLNIALKKLITQAVKSIKKCLTVVKFY